MVDTLVMDNQTAFNRVCEHLLLKQKMPSLSPRGRCAYRGEGGRSCAIGCLLSDDVAKGLDALGMDTTWRMVCTFAQGLSCAGAPWELDRTNVCKAATTELEGVSPQLLRDLQQAHDFASDRPEAWLINARERLRDVAQDHGLTKPAFL